MFGCCYCYQSLVGVTLMMLWCHFCQFDCSRIEYFHPFSCFVQLMAIYRLVAVRFLIKSLLGYLLLKFTIVVDGWMDHSMRRTLHQSTNSMDVEKAINLNCTAFYDGSVWIAQSVDTQRKLFVYVYIKEEES